MPQSIPQPNFTSGELSPSLYGRVDLNTYYSGLKTCRNFIVRPYGGIINRPGYEFVDEVSSSLYRHRLIPFQFSTIQTYMLVFGNYTMRIVMNGAYVVYPVGHPSAGQVVEIVSPYPASVLSRLNYTQSADVITICHPDYPQQQLSRTDHHLWTFSEFPNVNGPFRSINTEKDKTVYASAVTGSITLTASAGIFTSDMVGQMFYVEQSPDAQTKRWEVNKAITINDVKRAGANYYKALTSGTTGTVRPDHTEGVGYDGDPGVSWQYLHSGFGIVLITGFTSTTVVTGTVLSRLPDQLITGSSAKSITGALKETPSPGLVTVTCAAHGFATGDSVTITGVTGMTDLNGTWTITVIDANSFKVSLTTAQTYLSGGTATKTLTAQQTYKWALEAWGGGSGYPACTGYFQQRQLFGSTPGQPQTNWLSKTEGYTDFGASMNPLDDDAITFTLATNQVNEIRHFIEVGELVVLTSSGPFKVSGGQNGVLTPSSISIKGQGQGGCSYVPPVMIGGQALYVQEKGKQIRSLGYNFVNDQFNGTDLTVKSWHLFNGHNIEEWAFQAIPFSCVWAVRDDGVLLGFTYMPEQEIAAWHRHDTDGYVESVGVITEGNADVLYLIVRRTIGGITKRYIERMADRFNTDYRNSFFVDSGLSYDGRNTTAVTMIVTGGTTWEYTENLTLTASSPTFASSNVGDAVHFRDDANGIIYRLKIIGYTSSKVVTVRANKTLPAATIKKDGTNDPGYRGVARTDWELALDTMGGLSHLEGKTVSILADGYVQSQKVVTGGSVTLDFPASVVHIGLPIISDAETLDMSVPGQPVRDRQKIINHCSFILEDVANIWAGPDVDNLTEHKHREDENYDEPIRPVTGIIDLRITSSWSKGGRVFVRHDNPVPTSILAVIPEVTTGGT